MKNKKLCLLPISLLLAFSLAACSQRSNQPSPNDSSDSGVESADTSDESVDTLEDDDEEEVLYVPDYNDPTIYCIYDKTISNGSYNATDDEYTFSITQNYKQIYVNLSGKTVIVELNGVTIENSENSPIYVTTCDTIEISAKKDTVNNIKDSRQTYTTKVPGQGKAALYVVDGDLKLKGTGTLNITANYYNGVHGKDDVKVQKQTLNITAVNHAIRGNDSVTITSGTISLTCGGDGIHTENSDVSSKNKQRGNVTINGGTVTINSWSDAVQAAYNVVVEQTDNTAPLSLTAKTNKYSSYSGGTITTSKTNFYLKMNSTTYSNGNYTYAAYIGGSWYAATYKGTQSSGGQPGQPGGFGAKPGSNNTYYIYELDKPNGATSFTLYRFEGKNVTSFSTSSYAAVSDVKAFNGEYDMVEISISNKKINFDKWSNYATNTSGNNNKAADSAKGLKAENEIYIKSGTIDLKAYDDAIHANNDGGTLGNKQSPLGNVNISGGNTTLSASDDGVHADGQLNITGGQTNVTTAYEGLEGNVINISGGQTFVYATDDGVNATKGNSSTAINITGGFLDVEVSTSGDTDGIDSNGAYNQSGGTVIIKGPGSASSSGSPAAALDTDGTVTVTSGSLIVFGGIEARNPNVSSVTKTLCSSDTVNAGSHTVSFSSNGTSYSTTLKSSCRGCIVYSSLGTATLK